jgi:hypothetical protein
MTTTVKITSKPVPKTTTKSLQMVATKTIKHK